MRRRSAIILAALLSAAGCDDGEDRKAAVRCEPGVATGCAEGLVCEQVGSTGTACLPPIWVSGRVVDALSASGLGGATVVGLDANGAARTRVARSAADGSYTLPVSVRRDASGAPIQDAITLRVAAADHQPFPTAPRTALPIDLSLARLQSADGGAGTSGYVLANAATTVTLIPLPIAERGGVTVEGTVSASAGGGVLVLAVRDTRAVSSALSDRDGAFVLFNVPTGSVRIEGYRAGLTLTPAQIDVPGAGLTGVTLTGSSAALSTLSGSVNIVNATGGLTTSVILVVASTFDPEAVRGEAPQGLRAANVGGAFSIADVPPGRYAVLAAFENDLLVRDPDQGIAGTDVVFVDVPSGALSQSFKVTGALDVVSPGASGVESVVRGPVTLTWKDDSSEDGYELRVYDALGSLVHEDTQIASVTGSANVAYTLDAASFVPGMLYQFRVWSYRDRQGGRTYISATEDLRGVFQISR